MFCFIKKNVFVTLLHVVTLCSVSLANFHYQNSKVDATTFLSITNTKSILFPHYFDLNGRLPYFFFIEMILAFKCQENKRKWS